MNVLNNKPSNRNKNHTLLITLLLCIILLTIIIATAIIKIPFLANQFGLAVLSPSSYYTRIEEANATAGIDFISEAYSNLLSFCNSPNPDDTFQKIDLSLTSDNTATNKIPSISFNRLEAKIETTSNAQKRKTSIQLFANDAPLTTLNGYYDYANPNFFLQIPELSNAFIMIPSHLVEANHSSSVSRSLLEGPATTERLQNIFTSSLSEKNLNKLLKRYTKILSNEMSSVNNITLAKNQTLTSNGVKEKATKITLQISKQEMYGILKNILKSAKNDEDLMRLCNDLGICPEDSYKATIEMIITVLAIIEGKENNDNTMLEMTLWVNKNGVIIRREVTLFDNSTLNFGYRIYPKDNSIEFEYWATVNKDYVSGLGSITSNAISKSNLLTLKLTSNVLPDSTLTVTVTEQKQQMEAFSVPTDQDEIYDISSETELSTYLKESNIQSYVGNICTKLSIQTPADFTEQLLLYLHKFYN